MIPYGHQEILPQDIEAVTKVLQSDWLTQGPWVEKFEEAVATYCQAKYAVACSNATAALHLACLALGIGEGDIVWTSTNTFVASANCARYCGATVDFIDICSKTYNINIDELDKKLQLAEKNNRLPKLIIPVHFAGQSCDMHALKQLANKYKFYIVEDASHAIGGKYRNEPVGNCRYSDITVFSFHPVKIITTGEGGMALTNNNNLAKKIKLLRTHGVTRDTELMETTSHGDWYYQLINLGFNYRITDLQCALGYEQLQRLNQYVNQRKKIAEKYQNALSGLPLLLPSIDNKSDSAWHLYVVQIDKNRTKKTRSEIFHYLREAEIGVNVHYIPVHTQPYYQKQGFKVGDFPVAENYYENTLTLPMYSSMSNKDFDFIVTKLKGFSW